MLNVIFHNVSNWFEGWERKTGVLDWTLWQKSRFCLLVQGDGRHPHDDQVITTFEALTKVRCLTYRLSWSLGPFLWEEYHWNDRWRGMGGWWASPWWWATRHAAIVSVVCCVAWNYVVDSNFWGSVVIMLLFEGIVMLFIIYCRINQLLCIEDDVVYNFGNCMVIILVILHAVENHASWCTDFDIVLVCSNMIVRNQERVAGSKWESV